MRCLVLGPGERDLHVMRHPELWPLRSLLPLVRANGALATLVTAARRQIEGAPESPVPPPMPAPVLYPMNLHLWATAGCTCQVTGRAYPTLEAVLADGWRIL